MFFRQGYVSKGALEGEENGGMVWVIIVHLFVSSESDDIKLLPQCCRRKKSKNKAEQQSEEEVTEEPHHLEHDSPGSSNSKSSSTQQQQSGANLRSAATSLIVTASHLLLYLPALLLLGLQVKSIITLLFDCVQVRPALFATGATIGDGGESSSCRPLRSHCLLWISNSSYGAPIYVTTDAPGSPPDPQTAFALLLLILGDIRETEKEVQRRIPDVCTIMSLSITH